ARRARVLGARCAVFAAPRPLGGDAASTGSLFRRPASPGQTRARSSSLVTTLPAAPASTDNTSSARLPSRTGTPSRQSSRRPRSNRNRPNLASSPLSVQITGDVQIDDVRVFLSGSQNFSAAGWTFVRWHGVNGGGADHDVIHLFGSDGANTITGSSENDIIQGFGGADILNGGDGNDTFGYAGTDQVVAGEV